MPSIDLKDQYFGCEIEMTGLTRQQAAEAVASLFGTTAVHSRSSRTYDPWEVTDNEGKTWRFVYDSSIHGSHRTGRQQIPIGDGDYKVEMNSPKLEYSEMGKLQEVVRTLRHAGAVVNGSCGMHVHVDASKHTPQSLKNALSIMYSKEDILFKALNVNESRVERWCQKVREPMLEKIRKLPSNTTMDRLRREWYEGSDGSYEHYNWTRYYRYKNFLGYRPGENGEPEIDPEQAAIVSRIFFAFLSGDTPEQIAKSLEADHIPSPTGKPTWSKTTIRNMLQNEKYAGDVLLQKTYTADFLEKKVKKNRGEVKQYYITDNHPAIIPRDIFQEVQLEIARRSSKRKVSCRRTKSGRGKYTSKYALSERTVCGECGAMYRRTMWIKRDGTKEDVWRCVNRLEFGTKYCKHSPSLKEPILHQAILNCIQSVFHNKEEIAEAVREAQKKIILFEDAKNNPEVIRQRMQDIDHGMANLLTLAAQSSQTELFEKKFKEMTEEKARLAEQLKQAEEDATTDAKRQKQLDDILRAIDIDIVELTEFDDTFIRRIVEQVTILSKDKIEVRFIGGFSKVGDIPTK